MIKIILNQYKKKVVFKMMIINNKSNKPNNKMNNRYKINNKYKKNKTNNKMK